MRIHRNFAASAVEILPGQPTLVAGGERRRAEAFAGPERRQPFHRQFLSLLMRARAGVMQCYANRG